MKSIDEVEDERDDDDENDDGQHGKRASLGEAPGQRGDIRDISFQVGLHYRPGPRHRGARETGGVQSTSRAGPPPNLTRREERPGTERWP